MDMWEVGGASNFMITAARLGQRVACLGQLGLDVYGDFFSTIMEVSRGPARLFTPWPAHPQHLARAAIARVTFGQGWMAEMQLTPQATLCSAHRNCWHGKGACSLRGIAGWVLYAQPRMQCGTSICRVARTHRVHLARRPWHRQECDCGFTVRCKRWAQAEGVAAIQPLDAAAAAQAATLLCFVLVGPESQHAFTSRYDFGPWPLLSGVTSLQPEVLQVRLAGPLPPFCSCMRGGAPQSCAHPQVSCAPTMLCRSPAAASSIVLPAAAASVAGCLPSVHQRLKALRHSLSVVLCWAGCAAGGV